MTTREKDDKQPPKKDGFSHLVPECFSFNNDDQDVIMKLSPMQLMDQINVNKRVMMRLMEYSAKLYCQDIALQNTKLKISFPN